MQADCRAPILDALAASGQPISEKPRPSAQGALGPRWGRSGVKRAFYQSEAFAAAFTAAGVGPGARLLFEELVRASGRNGYTWALQGVLAGRLGVTDRTVRRWEAQLVAAGFLTVARVSLWARRRPGGVRRLAVPHVLEAGRFVPPAGILRTAKHVAVDGVKVSIAAVKRVVSHIRTAVSGKRGRTSSLSMERNQGDALPSPELDVEEAVNIARLVLDRCDEYREAGWARLRRYGWTIARVIEVLVEGGHRVERLHALA